jgi:prevent-host-death family protein
MYSQGVSENEIGLREGRARFGDLVNRAEYAGEITYITRHGRRVAAIVPTNRIAKEQGMNVQDLTTAVTTTLGDHVDDFDIPGIVEEIGSTYGYDIASIDEIPNDEYFRIAQRHDISVKTSTFTRDNDNEEWGQDTVTITIKDTEVTEVAMVDGIESTEVRGFSSEGEVADYMRDRRTYLTGEGYREQ